MSDTVKRLDEFRRSDAYEYGFEYADLLRAVGLTIVAETEFGSYQGDLLFHVRDGEGRDGLLIQGYGSCTGCDALQAAAPWDDDGDLTDLAALADQMRGEVLWAGDAGAVVALEAKLAAKADWWVYADDEALAAARRLAEAIDA